MVVAFIVFNKSKIQQISLEFEHCSIHIVPFVVCDGKGKKWIVLTYFMFVSTF